MTGAEKHDDQLKKPKGFQCNTPFTFTNLMRFFVKSATHNEHPRFNHNAESDCLISGDLVLCSYFIYKCCNEDVMMHYNNINSVHYQAVNAQYFENNTMQYSTVNQQILAAIKFGISKK